MKKEYDFSKARPNPYAARLKRAAEGRAALHPPELESRRGNGCLSRFGPGRRDRPALLNSAGRPVHKPNG
jgi:hypothetical protein